MRSCVVSLMHLKAKFEATEATPGEGVCDKLRRSASAYRQVGAI
jgi:hypothetical protein